jgi:hypothetical protein
MCLPEIQIINTDHPVPRSCEFVGNRSGAREIVLQRYCAASLDGRWTFGLDFSCAGNGVVRWIVCVAGGWVAEKVKQDNQGAAWAVVK